MVVHHGRGDRLPILGSHIRCTAHSFNVQRAVAAFEYCSFLHLRNGLVPHRQRKRCPGTTGSVKNSIHHCSRPRDAS